MKKKIIVFFIGIICLMGVVMIIFTATKAKNDEKTEYQKNIESLYSISAKEVGEKIRNEDSFYIYFGRESCEYCREFLPKLNYIVKEKKIKVFYLNTQNTDNDTKIRQIRDTLNVEYVPEFIYVSKKGKSIERYDKDMVTLLEFVESIESPVNQKEFIGDGIDIKEYQNYSKYEQLLYITKLQIRMSSIHEEFFEKVNKLVNSQLNRSEMNKLRKIIEMYSEENKSIMFSKEMEHVIKEDSEFKGLLVEQERYENQIEKYSSILNQDRETIKKNVEILNTLYEDSLEYSRSIYSTNKTIAQNINGDEKQFLKDYQNLLSSEFNHD